MFMFIFMWHACNEDVSEPNHEPNTLSTTAPLEAFGSTPTSGKGPDLGEERPGDGASE